MTPHGRRGFRGSGHPPAAAAAFAWFEGVRGGESTGRSGKGVLPLFLERPIAPIVAMPWL